MPTPTMVWTPSGATNFEPRDMLFGHIPDPRFIAKEVDRVLSTMPAPIFYTAAQSIKDSGAGKIMLLTKFLEAQLSGRFPIHTQTIGDCFPAGAIVLGSQTKPIEDVYVGDLVWTAEGKLTRVISIRAIETTRPLVKIHSVGGLPITCTADHTFLVYRMARVGGKRVNPTWYAKAQLPNQGFSKAAVITCYEGRHPEWVAAEDLRDTDCLLTPVKFASIPPPSDVPGKLWATPGGRRVLGFFLGNGHASGGSIELAVSNAVVEAELVETLIKAGFNPKVDPYRDDCGAWRIRVHDKAAVRWFRQHFYDRRKVKSFPGWALGDVDFIAGLKLADGHDTSDHHAIDSTSDSIISATMASLVQMGYEPTVGPVKRSGGEYPNAKPLWRVIWRENKQKSYVWRDESFVCRPVKKIEFLEGTATVYDIGVEDAHHSFLVNGSACHNCVSHGWGLGVDILSATQIQAGAAESFPGETATEIIYAGSRVEIGKGKCGAEDGSVGAWAAEFVTTYGTLLRDKYSKLDLTTYDGQTAKKLGAPKAGVPDPLEPLTREHPIKTTSLVRSYPEARDAIANGYPVPVCSTIGFESPSQSRIQRDKDGFGKRAGSWPHCMLLCGADDAFKRPGLLCVNSWGTRWITGPTRHEQPEGSFWVDADVVDIMLREGDSFTISGYLGYPAQPGLEYMLI